MGEKMTDLYNIVMQGKAISDRDDQEVKKNLAVLFKKPAEEMERLLSGKLVTVKKEISHDQAVKIAQVIKKAGAECKIVKNRKAVPQKLVMEESDKSDYDSKVDNNISPDREPYKTHESQDMSQTNPYKTPSANLIETKKGIIGLAEFKKVSTWIVFLFTMLTCGVYAAFWLYSRTIILNRLPSVKPISNGFMICTIIFWALSLLFSMGNGIIIGSGGDPNVAFSLVANAISIIASILPIVWYFKFRNRLNIFLTNHVGNGKLLGPILTFFLNVMYLSYKLNENIEIMEGQE